MNGSLESPDRTASPEEPVGGSFIANSGYLRAILLAHIEATTPLPIGQQRIEITRRGQPSLMVVEIGLLRNLLPKTDDLAVGRADNFRQRRVADWAEFKLN
jgi:hypothetical protein